MKAMIFCAALAAAVPAVADDLIARSGPDMVRLADKPCSSEAVLARLPQQQHAKFRAATAIVNGQSYTGCWIGMGGTAHLVYEDGDMGMIPMAELKAELSI